MKVYSFDNVLITHAKVPDEFIYKMLDTMEKNKDDLVAVQPVLREFTPAFGYKQYRRAVSSGRAEVSSRTRDLQPTPLEMTGRASDQHRQQGGMRS